MIRELSADVDLRINLNAFDVTIEIHPLYPDNAAILSGKKIACFYTISEMQAARNFVC